MTVLSTGEAAKRLQTSHDTVLRLIRSGELSANRLTESGHWRIRQEDLEEYAKQRGISLLESEEK